MSYAEPLAPGVTVRVPLTQGKTAVIDAEDAPVVLRYRWHALRKQSLWYAARHGPGPEGRLVYLHQAVIPAPDGYETDHVNGDGLDNTRANLRIVDSSGNSMNSRKREGCSSQYKGVSWHKSRCKWMAQIGANSLVVYLGLYWLEEDAARAYDTAARRYFKEMACLNFPEPGEQGCRTTGERRTEGTGR